MEKDRTPHDAGYKNFFSNPEMVASLLREFVPEDFVAELDFSTLERCSGSYVTDDLRERHDDVVWRVGWKDGWCYVLLLLEFQSSPDRWMALRMLSYTTLLLLDLVKSGQVCADGKLPPVFPLVIYNGSRAWRAPREAGKLFAAMPKSLRAYCPEFGYFLLDESRVPEEALKRSSGLAAQLLRLERARDLDEVRIIVRELVERLRGPEYATLRRAFTVWLGRVVLKRSGMTEEVPEFQDLQEVDAMLEERAARWKNEYIMLGEARGLAVGEARGIEIGEARGELRRGKMVLRALLRERFGELPRELEDVMEHLADADAVTQLTLEVWRAASLEAFCEKLRRAASGESARQ